MPRFKVTIAYQVRVTKEYEYEADSVDAVYGEFYDKGIPASAVFLGSWYGDVDSNYYDVSKVEEIQ